MMKPKKDSRKLNFLKRRTTLKKKARELSILCGVKVCMVCFGPDGSVETWPESRSEVKELIKQMYPKVGNGKGNDLKGFLEAKRKKKLQETQHKTMVEKGVLALDGLSEESLVELGKALNAKLTALKGRIEFSKREQQMFREGDLVSTNGGIGPNPPGFLPEASIPTSAVFDDGVNYFPPMGCSFDNDSLAMILGARDVLPICSAGSQSQPEHNWVYELECYLQNNPTDCGFSEFNFPASGGGFSSQPEQTWVYGLERDLQIDPRDCCFFRI